MKLFYILAQHIVPQAFTEKGLPLPQYWHGVCTSYKTISFCVKNNFFKETKIMARSRTSKSKHNTKVRQIARKLERQGYAVKADVPGYEQPRTIAGYRPDVVGKKGKSRRIIEVETPDSAGSARDQAQQKAFRQASKRSDNTTFKRTITK